MRAIQGLTRSLNQSGQFKYKEPDSIVDFLVVGAGAYKSTSPFIFEFISSSRTGVVGLAIAQRLSQRFPSRSTYILERHTRPGEETSSRNSEVIHSGLYYPADSLKTKLCLRGRDLLYERCKAYNIPFKQVGKLVVARHDQRSYIENLHTKSRSLQWPSHSLATSHVLPTDLISGEQARKMEPDLSDEIVAALWCPLTGIVDSHAFMESLQLDISESEAGELVLATDVVRLDPYRRPSQGVEEGWVVQVTDRSNNKEGYAILARTLINASGLSSALVLNSILSKDQQIPMYYARGSYASYHGPGVSQVSHLIYPCPETGPNAHAFESLGTHLTLDLQGKIRFGPDIEWMSPPTSADTESEDDGDFWMHNLIPDDSRLRDMHYAVTTYLPGVQSHGLQPDYVGIRPKMIPPGGGFRDFVLRVDYPSVDAERTRRSPMVSLLGIESPGLTSSLALSEIVVEDIVKKSIRLE